MSNEELLIRKAEDLGARLWADGPRLELDLPEYFPSSVLEELRRNKAAVLSWLTLPEGARPIVTWACWLVEFVPGEEVKVSFHETPLRSVTLALREVGGYISRVLGDLGAMQSGEAGGTADLDPGWRRRQIEELCGRLAALREALRPFGLADVRRDYR